MGKGFLNQSGRTSRSERGEARAAVVGLRSGCVVQPSNEAGQVDGDGHEDMMQVCFRLASIGRTAQPKAAGSLGYRALDPARLA